MRLGRFLSAAVFGFYRTFVVIRADLGALNLSNELFFEIPVRVVVADLGVGVCRVIRDALYICVSSRFVRSRIV